MTLDSLLACLDVVGGGLLIRPKPGDRGDAGDIGGSKLDARLCSFFGIGGIGGALESKDIVLLLGSAGEAALNVRSVIEPLLLDLSKLGRRGTPLALAALAFDAVDPLLVIRFVCTLPTGSGDVV